MNERTQGTVTGNAPCPHCDDDSQDECTKCGTLGLIQVEKSIDARWANRINECMKHVKVRDDICTPRYRETHGYPRSDTAHYIASVSDEDIDLAVFGIRYVGNQGRTEPEAKAAVADDLLAVAMRSKNTQRTRTAHQKSEIMT